MMPSVYHNKIENVFNFTLYNVVLFQASVTHTINATNINYQSFTWQAPPSGSGSIRFRSVNTYSSFFNYTRNKSIYLYWESNRKPRPYH